MHTKGPTMSKESTAHNTDYTAEEACNTLIDWLLDRTDLERPVWLDAINAIRTRVQDAIEGEE